MNKQFISLLIFIALLAQYAPVKAQANNDWLAAYQQPGEKVITLAQSLKYNGQVFQIHYFTTGELNIGDSYFIARASPEFFRKQHVTALLVSSNGKVITDEDVIEQVLLHYRAAHYLYLEQNEPMFYDPAGVAKEMKRFTNLPVFLQFWERLVLNKLFGTTDEEYTEAMRGILSTQLELPSDLQSATDDVVTGAKQYTSMSDAIEWALATNDLLSKSRRVRRNAKDWEKAFESWHRTAEGAQYVKVGGKSIDLYNALDLFEITAKLIWITNLQQDRSAELKTFVEHATGEAALDPDMILAYSRVSTEVDNAWLQRYHIMLALIEEHSMDLAERLSAEGLAKLLVDNSRFLSRLRISGYAWAHAISLASIAYLVGDFLFGINDTYHNFHIGVRTDEIRQKFQAQRRALIRQTRIQSVLVFDGELADQYRSAYLLEAYASARVYRLYADGVESSARSGIIDPIKKLFGQEYSKAGDDLRKIGIQIESDAEETLGYPSFLEEAQRLVRNRLFLTRLTVDDQSAGFTRQGEKSYWIPLSAGYAGESIWTYNQAGKPANSASWELTLKESGRYLIQAYIPAPTEEVKKPYSATARYVITHSQGTTEVIIDQAGKSGSWADLGVYEFSGDQKAKVYLEDKTGELHGEAAVVFDAVRFIPEGQMDELLQGEPFNWEHSLQELQIQAQDWWDKTSTAIEQAVNQWWTKQQEKIRESFDQWWQEQQKKLADALEKWWQRQMTEWMNQCFGSAFLPLGVLAGVFVIRYRRKNQDC